MPSAHLRVTRRCLVDDLGLSGDLVKKDAREFKNDHAAVLKFVTMRNADPAGGEPTHGPYSRGTLRSVHVGAGRAVTIWDAEENVCWLLAYDGFHRIGHPDDAYAVFNRRYEADDLLPTEADYQSFFDSDEEGEENEEDFLDRLASSGKQLLAQARSNPGIDAMQTWHDGGRQVMCVDVVVDGGDSVEEGWMGLTLPEDESLTDEELYDAVVRLIPPDCYPTYVPTFRGRERRKGEIVFHWET